MTKSAAKGTPKSTVLLYCTFCRRDSETVAKLIAGPGIYICDACVATCNSILDGEPVVSFPGWASLTDGELLASLQPAAAAVAGVEETVREQVAVLRERSVTWARIGDALGVSRQAAWERYSGEE
ncbi:MAG: hypothetical protein M5T61_03410 [Acidimicrobiia bacterium]|nr:hypothetical protein [Acidimicrobiia bacterium]